MGKRTITIDADDVKGGFDIAEKVFQDIAGHAIDIRNLDALFDAITEYGNGLRIVVKHAERLSPDARRMLDDALANSTGLEIVFEKGDGSSESRASAPMTNIHFEYSDENQKREMKSWWDVFYSRLVKVFLWIVALGAVVWAVLELVARLSAAGD